ncbi:MAG: hypothetical protein ACRCTQ_04225 [Brevinemataceae bacterium]
MDKFKSFLFFSFLMFTPWFIFAQTDPSLQAGPQFINAEDNFQTPVFTNESPDAQLYMPENFSPTDIIPPSREREDLKSFATPVARKPPVFWGGFHIGAQYGQYEALPYADIYFSPYVKLGPFVFMYEIPLRFDWQGGFVKSLWTTQAALVSKIEASLYYSKTNSFFKCINISITPSQNNIQGHGRFLYDLNPNLYGPYETYKSLLTRLDLSYAGINYFIANIAQPTLMSAEIYLRPLAGLSNPKFEYFKQMKLYFVYGLDFSPFQSFSPGLYQFGSDPDSPMFSMLEAGLDLPILRVKNIFDMMLFADFAFIPAASNLQFTIPTGSGISGGVLFTFIKKIPIKIEFSQALGFWQPRWMNIFYYIDMPFVNQDGITLPNKIMTTVPNLTYFNFNMGFECKEKDIYLGIEFFGSTDLSQQLWMTISFSLGQKLLKLFSLSAYWTVRALNKTGISFTPQNTVLEIRANYHMLPNMTWGILWKRSGQLGNIINIDQAGNESAGIGAKPFQFLGMDFAYRF